MRELPFTLKLFVKGNSVRMYPQYNQIDSDNPRRSGDSMNKPQWEGEYKRRVLLSGEVSVDEISEKLPDCPILRA